MYVDPTSRFSGVRNEPSAAVRTGPSWKTTGFIRSQVASLGPDLDLLPRDRLPRPLPDTSRQSPRRPEVDSDCCTLIVASRAFEQRQILRADRGGRDAHGDQLIACRQVVERRLAVRPGGDGKLTGQCIGHLVAAASAGGDVEDQWREPGSGDGAAVGTFDLDGSRLGLAQDQVKRWRVARADATAEPGRYAQSRE